MQTDFFASTNFILVTEVETEMLEKAPEIGRMLNISTWQVYQLNAEGKLPGAIRLAPRTWRFNREVLQKWIADGCPPIKPAHDEKQNGAAAHG